jgi:hypothetical protein
MAKDEHVHVLTIYIIQGSFGEVMLNHDLYLNVGCDFTYAIFKTILVVNVDYNFFIITN